jgi:hypothetical protein
MKFDTKKTKPMSVSSEHCFLRPNKFLPSNHDSEDDAATTGRQVYYEATIVYTPVYASSRIHQDQVSSGRKKLLLERDMDALSRQLEALFVGAEDEEETKEDDDKNDNKTLLKPVTKAVTFQEPASTIKQQPKAKQEDDGLGRRFIQTDGQKVSRSLRLFG